MSWNVTLIVLILCFFPVIIALGIAAGIVMIGFGAAYLIYKWFLWLYPYASPPIKWSLWHLSWPLRIVWSAFVGIVPSIRYMVRARLKRLAMKKSWSGSLDLEKGRCASTSGSVLDVAGTHNTQMQPYPNVNMASSSQPRQQPVQASNITSSRELLSKVSLNVGICGHNHDWHCWACEAQACTQCSVEISGLPPATQHFFCEPRCSRCYLHTMCGILPSKKSKSCSHRQNRCETLQTPRVCLSCSKNCSGDELVRRLGERESEELLHLARHNLKCGVCERRLEPKGPRWWTCCDCNEECDSNYHPPWSKVPELAPS